MLCCLWCLCISSLSTGCRCTSSGDSCLGYSGPALSHILAVGGTRRPCGSWWKGEDSFTHWGIRSHGEQNKHYWQLDCHCLMKKSSSAVWWTAHCTLGLQGEWRWRSTVFSLLQISVSVADPVLLVVNLIMLSSHGTYLPFYWEVCTSLASCILYLLWVCCRVRWLVMKVEECYQYKYIVSQTFGRRCIG